MRARRSSIIVPIIFIVFGIIFGAVTNAVYDDIVAAMWTPLAVALYFLVFGLLLCGLVMLVSRKMGRYFDRKLLRDMVLIVVALFLLSMLFEFLYELGVDRKIQEADAYVLMIDDSASMGGNDPEGKRATAIDRLLEDKSSDFPYAVYTFSNKAQQIRPMQPKSAGHDEWELLTSGGTAMFTCLETAISDISTGKLKITPATRVLLLSDGYATDAPLVKSNILKEFTSRNIVISTIGLGNSVDTGTMRHLAEYTGGVYVHVDDASLLDTAMLDAAVSSAQRNLLGFRGFCFTNTLHGILRVVFLLVMIGLIFVLKIYAYGKFYKLNLIISGLCCTIAGFLPEFALEVFAWNPDTMRMIFCVLISLTLMEIVKTDSCEDDLDEEVGNNTVVLGEIDSLTKKARIDGSDISSLQ